MQQYGFQPWPNEGIRTPRNGLLRHRRDDNARLNNGATSNGAYNAVNTTRKLKCRSTGAAHTTFRKDMPNRQTLFSEIQQMQCKNIEVVLKSYGATLSATAVLAGAMLDSSITLETQSKHSCRRCNRQLLQTLARGAARQGGPERRTSDRIDRPAACSVVDECSDFASCSRSVCRCHRHRTGSSHRHLWPARCRTDDVVDDHRQRNEVRW